MKPQEVPAPVIRHAITNPEIEQCAELLLSLRPHVPASDLVARVQRQRAAGYHLAFVEFEELPRAAAGYRFLENLAWGRFLYVDDLITREEDRGRGFGAKLIEFLYAQAIAAGCDEFHLDSGVQRSQAHEFYRRQGLAITSYHFSESCRALDTRARP